MKTLCGVDVSADFLDARVRPGQARLRVERTAEGIEVLAAFCREHGVQLVVMEATGGYERRPFKLLWGAGLPCAIVNPRQVRRFADAMGFLEKTDDIDAGLISSFPVRTVPGGYEIAKWVPINAFSRTRIDATVNELREEKALVSELLG